MSVLNNIQMNSDLSNFWYDYVSWEKKYTQDPTFGNLVHLNSAVANYRHTLDVHKPTKKEILYATAPEV